MKNRTFFIASMIFLLGFVMLFQTSYSLIVNTLVSEESYGFSVADFDVEFQDNTTITLNGVPTSDQDGMNNSKEFTFTVLNNSNYDVNYRIDIIEKSLLPMKDVIKYTYKINDGEYQEITRLSDNYTINQNRVLIPNGKDIYKIKLWISIDADETYMNKKFQATISLSATHNANKYATDVITYLGDNSYDSVVKDGDNYRYLANEKNYVWFNCMDNYTKGEDYCEKWAIVGSIKNTIGDMSKEYMMLKLVRNEIVEELTFNNEDLVGSYNDSYINSYANGAYYDLLNKHAQNLLIKAKWNIGNTPALEYKVAQEEEKKQIFVANIGLLNISDYLFLRGSAWYGKDQNFFTLNKDDVMVNTIKQNRIFKQDSKTESGFLPVVYIRPDASIFSGNGSINNPYELGIKYPMNLGKIT